jgi:hypothetical protein
MEKKGIKETMDVLDLIQVGVKVGKEVTADGKLNLFDLPKLTPLVPAAQKAYSGRGEIPKEVKDLDVEEVEQLAAKALAIAAEFMK